MYAFAFGFGVGVAVDAVANDAGVVVVAVVAGFQKRGGTFAPHRSYE
jgi:hypothetical protein